MDDSTLTALMEREHHEVDEAIADFVQGLREGDVRHADLGRATSLLQRHIYIEEAFIFPPLRAKGMLAPILVMEREHGQIWRTLDAVNLEVGSGTAADSVPDRCQQLLHELQVHNDKEEPIIYPQADALLTDSDKDAVRDFIDSGTMPDGWVCAQAANG
ncbi:hemerythrin [Intrasporangium chromatireducens Q5-1]|uniref:Hemerythrin n=1 Tax=Intrasporangium chromatireducens Q5-1 TaxID=584657 RepID=W9GM33_9MICO|nr:hemerythrin domain-containing protein [Intrasporangium chromatireducens]EWT05893.1 hemerythrin [Intrasporangium chromatireducens Q5-1]